MTRILNPDENGRLAAADLDWLRSQLDDGEVAATPAEGCYGLSARADRSIGRARVAELKGSRFGRGFIVAIGGREQLSGLELEIDRELEDLLFQIWPNAVTFVLPCRDGSTLAVRLPGDAVLRQLALDLGYPIVTTSANRQGAKAAASGAEVVSIWPEGLAAIIDAGPRPAGVPSTIVDLSGADPRIDRIGAFELTDVSMRRFAQLLWKRPRKG